MEKKSKLIAKKVTIEKEKDRDLFNSDPYKNQIVLNRIKTPDGTILTSYHRHDFVTHIDENGEIYMVDGGLDYLRRNVNKEPFEELSVYTCDPYLVIRDSFHRGSRGKNMDEELRWILLSEMTDDHLKATIEYNKERGIDNALSALYHKEIEYERKII